MKLAGKTAIITGAGAGIGRAIAQEYAREGAQVVVSDYLEETGSAVAAQLVQEGFDAIFIKADVSKEADIDNLVAKTMEQYGKLDILVNNAGISGTVANMSEITMDEWDSIMAINLKGPFLAIRRALPEMVKNGGGVVINMASMASLSAGRGGLAYTAAKHGLLGFTKQVALMHGWQKIRVNAILPGPVDTAMIQRVLGIPEHPVTMKINASPAGRVGQPEEVAKLAVFIATDDASFIHGAGICIDGGYTIF